MARRRLEAKALLIDLDGTIVDSADIFEEAVRTAFSTIGHDGCSEKAGWEIARRLQLNLPLDDFFSKNTVDNSLREKFLAAFLQAFYKAAKGKTRLFPNVEKTLDKLSEEFKLALITRRRVPRSDVEKELKRLRIEQHFGSIVTALDVEKPTPSPEAIAKAAEELQVAVTDCVVVSDSGVDIQAAKAAGAKTVAVLSGLFKRGEVDVEAPDLIITDIKDLPKHVLAKKADVS